MKKNKEGFHVGRYVKFDLGDIGLTPDLERALEILDSSCSGGSGGSWGISESTEKGIIWEAEPLDGPFDTVFFDGKRWVEELPEED